MVLRGFGVGLFWDLLFNSVVVYVLLLLELTFVSVSCVELVCFGLWIDCLCVSCWLVGFCWFDLF